MSVESNSKLIMKGSAPNQILQVSDQNLNLAVGKMRMRLNNLFNGDPILGKHTNIIIIINF